MLRYLLLTLSILIIHLCQAQNLPAFPGAEGFGSKTIGGRGGKIIEVTNLNESGAGSLKEALLTQRSRTVIFRTGGTISLTKDLFIDEPYITIAGQTAPGDGICIRGAAIRIRTHDVIIRNLRFRVGDSLVGPDPDNRDGLTIENSAAETDPSKEPFNIIIDHCSVSWAVDENMSLWYPCHDITIQNCIISEGLHKSLHSVKPGENPGHSTGLIIGWHNKQISVHHNLFAHNNGRNPNVTFDTETELINNVIYNWGDWEGTILSNFENVNFPTKSNIIGNYYKPLQYPTYPITLSQNLKTNNKIYIKNNSSPVLAKMYPNLYSSDDWWLVDSNNTNFRSYMPAFTPSGISEDDTSMVLDKVLNNAGAIIPHLDTVDRRAIFSTKNGTGKIIDNTNQVGGWPQFKTGNALSDLDHDGMPDHWEDLHGLNKNLYADANNFDLSPEGYTNIEVYINGLFDTSATTKVLDQSPIRADFTFTNPNHAEAHFNFNLPNNSEVGLFIYNLQGILIKTLVNSSLQAGQYQYSWNNTNQDGELLPGNIYLVLFKNESNWVCKKLVMLR
ncbi:MAG: hypothetical protein ACKOXB_14480 [Flavobacteriales bacterium]